MSSTKLSLPAVIVEEMETMETKKRATRAYVPDGEQEDHTMLAKKSTTAPALDGRLVTRIETRSNEASIASYQIISVPSVSPVMMATQTVASDVDFGKDMSMILSPDIYHPKGFLPEYFQTMESPANFGVIVPGIYRCSYPRTAANFEFVKALSLRTIVTLVDDELPDGFQHFTASNSIRHIVIGMKGTKKAAIPLEVMRSILKVVLDQSHHPLLIHCNQGKHRTGCVAGVIKKACGWDAKRVVEEYISYATPKERATDIAYLEGFDLGHLSDLFETSPLAAPGRHVSPFMRVLAAVMICLIIWFVTAQRIAESLASEV